MTRVSVKEAYSNRDLIAQIARLKTYVEQGTFKEVSSTYIDGELVLTFTAFDDSTQSFNIPMDSIVGITGDQVGNTVTLHVEFASGTVVDIPYTIANADTSPTPDTLGLRDGSGKLFAADPASGATDKTLVTANWVSQTGDSAPNNLVHRTGNETMDGVKTSSSRIDYKAPNIDLDAPPSYMTRGLNELKTKSDLTQVAYRKELAFATAGNSVNTIIHAKGSGVDYSASLQLTVFTDGTARLRLVRQGGTVDIVPRG